MIPDSIAGLVNLERLDLQHNQLKVLPDSIGLLKNLKSIDVSKNLLRVFPASLGHCRYSKRLVFITMFLFTHIRYFNFRSVACVASLHFRSLPCLFAEHIILFSKILETLKSFWVYVLDKRRMRGRLHTTTVLVIGVCSFKLPLIPFLRLYKEG